MSEKILTIQATTMMLSQPQASHPRVNQKFLCLHPEDAGQVSACAELQTPEFLDRSLVRSSRLSKAASHVFKNSTTGASQSHRSQGKKNKSQRLPTAKAGSSQMLYLRVNRKFLCLLSAPTADQPGPQPMPPPGTTGNLNVIIANLPDLIPFAGDTVDWLIHIARLIFEPLGTSSLYTFTTESLEWWLDREMEPSQWRKVAHGEPLRATIYEYRSDNDTPITLTRMSLRPTRSVTIETSEPPATTFRGALLRRDRACIVSQLELESILYASHLIPRRLGDFGVQSVTECFLGSSTIVDRFDPIVGVLLLPTLDALASHYKLGFWNTGPDQYVVHLFFDMPLNYSGGPPTPGVPELHGHQISLNTHDPSLPLPPVGVFNWHYMQEYGAYSSDDDESVVDFDNERNITDPPYPSYLWELSELRERQRVEGLERDRDIATWSSAVSGS
ncbi:unnamed protein product [Cyclocybe aegerita]|uniref:Uncharacterized protein n=1 Tax=Cyclocybe aegerita TaxID=1973307 RepID=A0A8S0WBN3_CYCAE|nr:unnamed protein product [Cyclocybe aegerita]